MPYNLMKEDSINQFIKVMDKEADKKKREGAKFK